MGAGTKHYDARSSSQLVGLNLRPGSLLGHRLMVATKGGHMLVYDVRKMSENEQSSETNLRCQTRSVCCLPDGTGTHLRRNFCFVLKSCFAEA